MHEMLMTYSSSFISAAVGLRQSANASGSATYQDTLVLRSCEVTSAIYFEPFLGSAFGSNADGLGDSCSALAGSSSLGAFTTGLVLRTASKWSRHWGCFR